MPKKIKYTTKTYSDKVNELSGGNFTVLGHYVRGNIKIRVRHNTCGTEYEIVASALLSQLRKGNEPCKHCCIEHNKISKEEFENKIHAVFGSEYALAGEYIDYTHHVEIKHLSCGRTWNVIPRLFIQKKKGCPYCAKHGHVDLLAAQERINQSCNHKFRILEYIGASKPLRVLNTETKEVATCKSLHILESCGEKWKPRHKKDKIIDIAFREQCEKQNSNFTFQWLSPKKARLTCKKCGESFNHLFKIAKSVSCLCATPPLKKGTEAYVVNQLKVLGDRYKLLSKYVATSYPTKFLHKKCGTEFTTTPGRLLYGLKHNPEKDPCCPNCQGKKGVKKTTQEYQAELDAKTNKSFHLLSEYVDERTPVKVRHRCGHEYFVTPKVLNTKDSYSACPACSSSTNSSGSQKIEHYFISHNIEYSKEYSFPDLRDKTSLRFDFAVMNNGHLVFLVEFDGPQHFKPVSIFGGEDYLSTLQLHDNMKDEYCRANNIALKRISYEQEDLIEQILSDAIKEFVI